MTDNSIVYAPIGVIRSPFTKINDMPIQPAGAQGIAGRVELDPVYTEGLKDLDGFSHIYLLYHFHECRGYSLIVTPFLDEIPRGLFATRAPKRPNPIGLSVVRIRKIEKTVIHILDVDVLDGTPVLDIKPYVRQFDAPENPASGWIGENDRSAEDVRSDGRFR